MRIRKHAKISGLLLAQTSGSTSQHHHLQTHICQLNQSPWDVIDFPPDSSSLLSTYQVDRDDSFAGNGSLGDSGGPVESVASMKVEMEVNEEEGGRGFGNVEAVMCCKSDGKGWQCRREAKEGHTLCDHHFAQLKNYNILAHASGRKSDSNSEKGGPIGRRPRTKKAAEVSNQHEFYYYSGFGPRWGKKRGNNVGMSSDIKTKFEPVNEVRTLQIDEEECDYIEDEDDDDDENQNGEIGKKRARKPIKARSLKSLM